VRELVTTELGPTIGLEVVEKVVRPEELRTADEVFLTNALMGIVPLTVVDSLPIGTGVPGPVSLKLRAELERSESVSSGFSFLPGS
jgi:branched-subunit amino acid aminotransferase/4-amino-4-deoxychorismate lyase